MSGSSAPLGEPASSVNALCAFELSRRIAPHQFPLPSGCLCRAKRRDLAPNRRTLGTSPGLFFQFPLFGIPETWIGDAQNSGHRHHYETYRDIDRCDHQEIEWGVGLYISGNFYGAFLVLEGRSYQDEFPQESVPRDQKQVN